MQITWEVRKVSVTGGCRSSTAELWLVPSSSQHPLPQLWLITQELCPSGQPTQQFLTMIQGTSQKQPASTASSFSCPPAYCAHMTASHAKTWSQLFGQPVRGSFQCICIFLVVITTVSHRMEPGCGTNNLPEESLQEPTLRKIKRKILVFTKEQEELFEGSIPMFVYF